MSSSPSTSSAAGVIDVLTVGHALVDVLAGADEEFLEREGLTKGAMQLIDAERAQTLYQRMGPGSEASGGSAANTATGVVACGGSAAFIGTVANDQLGDIFAHDIRAVGVTYRTPPLVDSDPTGRCMVLITPDGERTMNTYLGAAAGVGPAQLEQEIISAATITYLEGYMLDTPQAASALQRTAELVESGGRSLAITLSDSFCVERHGDLFLELLDGPVDICFGNEQEACQLFGVKELDDALDQMAKRCSVVAITKGAAGSVLIRNGERVEVPAKATNVVDTTGAGDLYAAGVLTGLARGMDLAACGALGARAASAVISQMGARLSADL